MTVLGDVTFCVSGVKKTGNKMEHRPNHCKLTVHHFTEVSGILAGDM